MPDLFVAPPGWSWDIVLYFFFGGLAGGVLFTACALRLVGRLEEDAPISRLGWYLAFPLINVCALLLIKDLGVPSRFLHMLVQSERLPLPMFKWWAPMSAGSWILAVSGAFALLSFVHALLEGEVLGGQHRAGRVTSRVRGLTAALHRGGSLLGGIYLATGALAGLVLAGYTGVLLNVTNAPTWSHDPLLPAIFVASGLATGAAALFLLAHATSAGSAAARRRVLRTAALAVTLEAFLVLIAVVLGIGHVSPFFLGWWGVFFWVIVLPIGLLLPAALLLMVEYRGRSLIPNAAVVGAVLLLVGGLLFRTLEVLGGQAYFEPY